MQFTIITKFTGPTDYGGAKITARAQMPKGTLVMPYSYALGPIDAHAQVAEALAIKLGATLHNAVVENGSTGYTFTAATPA